MRTQVNPELQVAAAGRQEDLRRACPCLFSAEQLEDQVMKMASKVPSRQDILFPKRDNVQGGRKN